MITKYKLFKKGYNVLDNASCNDEQNMLSKMRTTDEFLNIGIGTKIVARTEPLKRNFLDTFNMDNLLKYMPTEIMAKTKMKRQKEKSQTFAQTYTHTHESTLITVITMTTRTHDKNINWPEIERNVHENCSSKKIAFILIIYLQ